MTMNRRIDPDQAPLDEAARAAWLYYVGGKTQDQIARELGISRQRAQRLVSRAVAEGLIQMRLNHRTASCLALEERLAARFGLTFARVALGLGAGADPAATVGPTAAAEIERVLTQTPPQVIGFGTGRMLRAAVEEMGPMGCPQHRLVSLIGNISPDGSASFHDVIMRLADKVRARHYPMPLPVLAASEEERRVYHAFGPVAHTRALAERAGVIFVGVGEVTGDPPLVKDGFLSRAEMDEILQARAAGEICGWAYDVDGRYVDVELNRRLMGVRVDPAAGALVVGVAAGPAKVPAMRAALKGRILTALVTDEATAALLLAE